MAKSLTSLDHKIVDRSIADLKPHRTNARTHSPAQIKQIADSIAKFGFLNPVLIDTDGRVGYRLEDRKLYVEPAEAETVTRIFQVYLECGSMAAATEKLEELGIKTKQRAYRTGQIVGGVPFTRGGLQHLLRNAIYRGQIVHKQKIWPGEHDAIIDEVLWQKVQDRFDRNYKGGNRGEF